MIIHPDWDCRDPLNTPDIALVRLKHPLDLAEHTPPCFHSWKKWEFFWTNSEILEQKLLEEIRRNSGDDYQIGQQIQK